MGIADGYCGRTPLVSTYAGIFVRQRLPGLTRGEGVLECSFSRHEPVTGPPPTRPRSDHNPLNREEYLLHVARRIHA